jgi:hypothetical protein
LGTGIEKEKDERRRKKNKRNTHELDTSFMGLLGLFYC